MFACDFVAQKQLPETQRRYDATTVCRLAFELCEQERASCAKMGAFGVTPPTPPNPNLIRPR